MHEKEDNNLSGKHEVDRFHDYYLCSLVSRGKKVCALCIGEVCLLSCNIYSIKDDCWIIESGKA